MKIATTKYRVFGIAIYSIVIIAFVCAFFLQDAHAQERKYLGLYKGTPIYAHLNDRGGVEITFSSTEMKCPSLYNFECTYIPVYIDLSRIPEFKDKK